MARDGWNGHNFFVRGDGYIFAVSSYISSDERYKKDINNLGWGKETKNLFKLQAVSYRIDKSSLFQEEEKEEEILDSNMQKDSPKSIEESSSEADAIKHFDESKTTYGFIAQDLKELFPELVDEDEHGYMFVNYVGIIPIIVEVLKKQQIKIDELTSHIAKMEQQSQHKGKNKEKDNPESSSTDELQPISAKTTTTGSKQNAAKLKQNSPNPFSTDTRIGFHLPEDINNATLHVYNMQGTQLKAYPIYQRGQGEHTIFASSFTPGMYLYTLIADGKEVDTKRMILTK